MKPFTDRELRDAAHILRTRDRAMRVSHMAEVMDRAASREEFVAAITEHPNIALDDRGNLCFVPDGASGIHGPGNGGIRAV